MSTQIILSTRNPSKAKQIKGIFEGSPLEILTLAEAGIEGEADETGDTLVHNAMLKAEYAFARSNGRIAMADDTGIVTDAFPGWPGVKSARWAGDVPTEEITKRFLERMKGARKRSATFRTIVSIIADKSCLFIGEVRGTILEAPRMPPQPNMPYSGIFVPDGFEKVWAEMTNDEENAISHRGIAFRKARKFLERHLEISSA